jgi:hypothetical protein
MAWSIFDYTNGDYVAVIWAVNMLEALNPSWTTQNPPPVSVQQFVFNWEKSEGGGGKFNPLNQGPVTGEPQLTSTGQQYGGGASDFVSWAAGIAGAVAYLNYSNYAAVLAAILKGDGNAAATALWASPWAGSHYGYGRAWNTSALPPPPAFVTYAQIAAAAGMPANLAQAGAAAASGSGTAASSASTDPNAPPVAAIPVNYPVTPGSIPPLNPYFRSASALTSAIFTSWPFTGATKEAVAEAITTESTVDLAYDQLSQVQLTVVDPDWSLTGHIIGQVNQIDAQTSTGANPPQNHFSPRVVGFNGELMAVSEYSTTGTDGVPCAVLTMRDAVLEYMASTRTRATYPGISATQWIQLKIFEYNQQTQPANLATFLGQPSLTRDSIVTNLDVSLTAWDSDYSMAQQLAMEEGYWLFQSGNCVVFGQPTWIADRAQESGAMFRVNYSGLGTPRNPYSFPGPGVVETIGVPECLRSDQIFTGDQMTLFLPRDVGEQCHLGQKFQFTGIPKFGGLEGGQLLFGGEQEFRTVGGPLDAHSVLIPTSYVWMVTGVQYNLDAGATAVQIMANQIKDPAIPAPGGVSPIAIFNDPTGNATGNAGNGTNPGGAGTAAAFTTIALKQQQRLGSSGYIYGATPAASDLAPLHFDCSSFVQWCLEQIGIIGCPRTSGDQYAWGAAANLAIPIWKAQETRGALVFLGPGGDEHVAISLGTATGEPSRAQDPTLVGPLPSSSTISGATYVEAANHVDGIITGSDSSNWTCACLVPGLTYSGTGS